MAKKTITTFNDQDEISWRNITNTEQISRKDIVKLLDRPSLGGDSTQFVNRNTYLDVAVHPSGTWIVGSEDSKVVIKKFNEDENSFTTVYKQGYFDPFYFGQARSIVIDKSGSIYVAATYSTSSAYGSIIQSHVTASDQWKHTKVFTSPLFQTCILRTNLSTGRTFYFGTQVNPSASFWDGVSGSGYTDNGGGTWTDINPWSGFVQAGTASFIVSDAHVSRK